MPIVLWTTEEENLLREHYASGGPDLLCELLPHRSRDAISLHARKINLRNRDVDCWRPGERRCARCHNWKPFVEFCVNRSKTNGVHMYCRSCSVADRNPKPLRRKYYLKGKYRLSLEQFEHLYLSQKGLCAICNREILIDRDEHGMCVHIDHCHETGVIRGLLCSKCNIGIGHFVNSPELLRKAAEYLEGASKRCGNETTSPDRNSRSKESIL